VAWKVRKKKGENSEGNRRFQPSFVLAVLALLALSIYLFVSAPPPLADGQNTSGRTIKAEALLDMVAAENDAFRTLYTKNIVGPGLKQGFLYDENWLKRGAQSGPLPAVALRGVSVRLDRSKVGLGLFLGAAFAINRGNRFEGEKLALFQEIVADKQPRYFRDAPQGLWVGMYPDIAHAKPCVDCHSKHPKTPKTDWVLGDVMGATTWSFTSATVSAEEAVVVLGALRRALSETYKSYVDRARQFEDPPAVGSDWPSACRCLPDTQTFMAEVFRISSPSTTRALFDGFEG